MNERKKNNLISTHFVNVIESLINFLHLSKSCRFSYTRPRLSKSLDFISAYSFGFNFPVDLRLNGKMLFIGIVEKQKSINHLEKNEI